MNKQEIEKRINSDEDRCKYCTNSYMRCGMIFCNQGYTEDMDCEGKDFKLDYKINEVLSSQELWIPTSERLPEETGEYQCTVEWYGTSTKKQLIENNHIIEKRVINVCFLESISAFKEQDGFCTYEVIAWQPLPEAYKEVSDAKRD